MPWSHPPTAFLLALSFQEVENDPSTCSVGPTATVAAAGGPVPDAAGGPFVLNRQKPSFRPQVGFDEALLISVGVTKTHIHSLPPSS